MDTASLGANGSKSVHTALENGWYLLRKNLRCSDRVHRAGSLLEHIDGEWFLRGPVDDEENLSLTAEMVCRTSYHGISLYEVECTERGALFARPVLSELPFERVDPVVVHLSLLTGDGQVCVKFGHCFLPLELFNW
jgi:hypothetical protein